MAYKVMIDAGHGGADFGATYNGRQEKNDNLRLALAVGEILSENGIDVEYTRTTDIYQTPFEKATLGNQSGADFFISFHRTPSAENPVYYRVQTGAFKNRANAENMLYELQDKGFPAFLLYQDGVYKVQVGAFRNLSNAVKMENTLRRAGYSTWIDASPASY